MKLQKISVQDLSARLIISGIASASLLSCILIPAQFVCAENNYAPSDGQNSSANVNLSPMQQISQRRLRLRQLLDGKSLQGTSQGGRQDVRSPQLEASFAAIDPKRVTVRRDVAYGSEARQNLDVYSPAKSTKPSPVIFFVHGGGWEIGNKAQGHVDKGITWAENGIVFVSINYRLAPEVMHPKQIQDVAQAFAWVKKHAAEIGADSSQMFIMGHSAGAHLVDLLGTNGRFLAEQGLSLQDVKGVISLDTASFNLAERVADSSREGLMVGGMIKNAFGTDGKVLADASPECNVRKGISYPPFLLICGKSRSQGCIEQHERFVQDIEKAGGVIKLEFVPFSHADISKGAGNPDSEIFKKALAFVRS